MSACVCPCVDDVDLMNRGVVGSGSSKGRCLPVTLPRYPVTNTLSKTVTVSRDVRRCIS